MIQLLGILVVALLLYLGQKTIYQKVWHKNLRVRLSFQEEGIWEGQESTLSEIIENQKKLPLTMLKVKFQTDRHLLFADTKGSRTTDKFYRNDIFQIGALEKVTQSVTLHRRQTRLLHHRRSGSCGIGSVPDRTVHRNGRYRSQ